MLFLKSDLEWLDLGTRDMIPVKILLSLGLSQDFWYKNQRLFQVDYLGQPLRIGRTETMSDRLFFFHVRINFTCLVFSVLVPIQINTNYLLIQKNDSLQKMVNLCLLNHSRGLTGGHAADRHTHHSAGWMDDYEFACSINHRSLSKGTFSLWSQVTVVASGGDR